ncbi:hypothetical protein MTR67_028159 [Solanum verrucosum]|uniref:Uncharacterized protein n=1 Tax=Solanum verrucosum TaxID=315347 RepID=A0AAF0RAV2_SOLVR|nr:hypothetical protein MTR67_028159 [Solanum verrucosum]
MMLMIIKVMTPHSQPHFSGHHHRRLAGVLHHLSLHLHQKVYPFLGKKFLEFQNKYFPRKITLPLL